jgi:hypothetical protein
MGRDLTARNRIVASHFPSRINAASNGRNPVGNTITELCKSCRSCPDDDSSPSPAMNDRSTGALETGSHHAPRFVGSDMGIGEGQHGNG